MGNKTAFEFFFAEVGREGGEKVEVGASFAVRGLFGGVEEVGHVLWGEVPEEGGVVEKALFSDILCVAADFLVVEGKVVLLEGEVGQF